MASNKIELDIGGKYSAGQMFKQLDDDVKAAGKSMKDMGQGAMTVANNIAGAMGEKVNGTLKSTIGIVGEMARGGIWGAMATAASAAIGFVADKLKEARERAKELAGAFAELMGGKYKDSFKNISDQLNTTKQDMADATKEADNMLKALNGKVSENAKQNIARLHVEALQKMTDATTEATKKAVEAQTAYTEQFLRGDAEMERANNELNAANTKRAAAETKYNATSDALEATKAQQEKLETVYKTQIQRRTDLQENLNRLILESSLSEENAKKNADQMAWTRAKLAELEEQNKAVFEQRAAGEKQIMELERELAVSDQELTNANRAVTAANRHIETVKLENAASEQEAKAKRDAANAALAKETQATEAAIQQKELEAQQQIIIDKIKAYAAEKDVEYTQYVELATKMLKDGYSEQTILNRVRSEYRMALEEATKQQQEENKASKGKGGNGSTTAKTIAEGVASGLSGVSVNTSVNTGEVGDGVDNANEVITLGKLQRDVRNDQRQMRDKQDVINQSTAAMKTYLQGKMSPEVAQKFAERIKEQGLTLDDLEKMNKKQLSERLMTKSEQKENAKNIEQMKKMLEKLGLK